MKKETIYKILIVISWIAADYCVNYYKYDLNYFLWALLKAALLFVGIYLFLKCKVKR